MSDIKKHFEDIADILLKKEKEIYRRTLGIGMSELEAIAFKAGVLEGITWSLKTVIRGEGEE